MTERGHEPYRIEDGPPLAHGDGEQPGIGDLEILRVWVPRDCGHCGGLLLADPSDPGHLRCSECSRSPGHPTRVDDPEVESSKLYKALSGRVDRPGAGCIPQASLNSFTSRFA